MPRPIAISLIGSTGSIGQSTLKVVDRYPDRLRVVGLATGRNVERLLAQKERYRPEIIAVADDSNRMGTGIRTGAAALEEVAAWPSADVTVIATVGFAGVCPTLAAIRAGKKIALANKETLVAAGAVVMPEAHRSNVSIAPIDSEHSAIWQCLRAGEGTEVRRIILTGSGGPFLNRPLDTFSSITRDEALAHPTWQMGPRITIDSATMMNKGFEIIEAAWLFGIPPEHIDVVIHPQSIVHSMVEFQDGSVIAQLGLPDMTSPIAHALFAPERPPAPPGSTRYLPGKQQILEFSEPDFSRYPALGLARWAFGLGPTGGTVLNAADEVAVDAFLEERLPFTRIIPLVEQVLHSHTLVASPTFEDIERIDHWARCQAGELISPLGARLVTS